MADQLHGASAHAELTRRAMALLARAPAARDPASRLAVLHVTTASKPLTVRQLAERLGRSTRTIQRAFADDIGLAPKALLRIVRIQRAMALALRHQALGWSTIAVRAGYADQPHFVRDFRSLVGCSPREFRPEQPSLTATFVDAGGVAGGPGQSVVASPIQPD
jgi:AraC-like DNA-binding protein